MPCLDVNVEEFYEYDASRPNVWLMIMLDAYTRFAAPVAMAVYYTNEAGVKVWSEAIAGVKKNNNNNWTMASLPTFKMMISSAITTSPNMKATVSACEIGFPGYGAGRTISGHYELMICDTNPKITLEDDQEWLGSDAYQKQTTLANNVWSDLSSSMRGSTSWANRYQLIPVLPFFSGVVTQMQIVPTVTIIQGSNSDSYELGLEYTPSELASPNDQVDSSSNVTFTLEDPILEIFVYALPDRAVTLTYNGTQTVSLVDKSRVSVTFATGSAPVTFSTEDSGVFHPFGIRLSHDLSHGTNHDPSSINVVTVNAS